MKKTLVLSGCVMKSNISFLTAEDRYSSLYHRLTLAVKEAYTQSYSLHVFSRETWYHCLLLCFWSLAFFIAEKILYCVFLEYILYVGCQATTQVNCLVADVYKQWGKLENFQVNIFNLLCFITQLARQFSLMFVWDLGYSLILV